MLVLTRKPSETIVLELPNGDRIDVLVTAIRGNHVRLGIDAPDYVLIAREELLLEE